MRNFITIFFTLFSLTAAAQTGGIDVSRIAVTNSGDSVLLEMTLSISPDAVTELQGMELIPTLTGRAGERALFPGVVVNGRNRARIYARHKKFHHDGIVGNPPYRVVTIDRNFAGDTIAYSARIPAAPWMDSASPSLVYALVSPAGERHLYSAAVSGVSAAVSVRPTDDAPPESAFTGENEIANPPVETVTMGTASGTVSGSADLYFAAGSPLPATGSEHNRRELEELDDAFGRIVATPGARILSVTVTGYSSPDGHYDANVSIARDRGEAFARLLRERYGLSDAIIKVRAAGENWSELRAAVVGSEMPARDEILAVIDSADAPDAKESHLRRMNGGEVWRMLEQSVFAALRRVDYSIDYTLD